MLSVLSAVVQASDLPSTGKSRAYVEFVTGDLHRRTETLQQNKNASMRWEAQFILYIFTQLACKYVPLMQRNRPVQAGTSKMTFTVLHHSIFRDTCLGRCEIDVEDLLGRQIQQTDGGECLLLFDRLCYNDTLTIQILFCP